VACGLVTGGLSLQHQGVETRTFIAQCLRQVQQRLLASATGMSAAQLAWRPAPHGNDAGHLLWHLARSQDAAVARIGGAHEARQGELWETSGWRERFGRPEGEPPPGDHAAVAPLPLPLPAELLGYLDATFVRAIALVEGLDDAALDRALEPAPAGEPALIVAAQLRHLLTHANHHHGQLDYLRGLQQPGWDLPRGTGLRLPT
jgi:uncharacterized damage-inducible protein DinB